MEFLAENEELAAAHADLTAGGLCTDADAAHGPHCQQENARLHCNVRLSKWPCTTTPSTLSLVEISGVVCRQVHNL